MKDTWESVDQYDYFMGRWSGCIAQEFIQWLAPAPGLTWLDVGCGSGALSQVIMKNCEPAELTAIDQSDKFVSAAQKQLGNSARCKIGNAMALPLKDASVHITVSGLVLNFIPEPIKALVEMRRVTTAGGTVALYVWDYIRKKQSSRCAEEAFAYPGRWIDSNVFTRVCSQKSNVTIRRLTKTPAPSAFKSA